MDYPKFDLDGHCAKGYEPVKEEVNRMLRKKGVEGNVQLCVYVDGECVVDLFGTAIGDRAYTKDTIQV